jgi:hypothetical protein
MQLVICHSPVVNVNLVMSTHSVSCAKQSQDLPAIIANPDACSDFTKLSCFFIYVDLQVRQLGESYCSSKTSRSSSDNRYSKQIRWR